MESITQDTKQDESLVSPLVISILTENAIEQTYADLIPNPLPSDLDPAKTKALRDRIVQLTYTAGQSVIAQHTKTLTQTQKTVSDMLVYYPKIAARMDEILKTEVKKPGSGLCYSFHPREIPVCDGAVFAADAVVNALNQSGQRAVVDPSEGFLSIHLTW